jgi:hypothetical protein
MVACISSDGGALRFTQAAVDTYSQSLADSYARSADLGPDPYEGSPGASVPSDPEPSVPEDSAALPDNGNIPNYDKGNGYRVQCNDGMYSQSGGIQGACSGHGGVAP